MSGMSFEEFAKTVGPLKLNPVQQYVWDRIAEAREKGEPFRLLLPKGHNR